MQHEQDRERLEDQIRQGRLIRYRRDERRVDLVPQLWTDAVPVIVEK